MHLHQIVALGTALMATGASAAPMSGADGQHLAPIQYRSAANGAINPQALFTAGHERSLHHHKRKPSKALEAVISFVNKRFVSNEHGADGDEEEQDGSDPSHYYKPIGRGPQKAFAAKRDTAQCNASTTSTSATATTAKATSTSKASTAATTPTTTKAAIASTSTKASTSTTKAASSSTTKNAAAVATGKGGGGLVSGYWPSWSSGTLPPENIAWSKFDLMFYAFAVPTSSGSITIDDSSMLKRFVKAAKAGNTKAILSLGGWGQSSGFSKSVASDSARSKFITSVLNVISTYSLDGVDFDWEYPADSAAGTFSSTDTKNFQTFLTDLRAKIPSGKIMSAAVPQQVWQASSGNPVGSVARAGAALDHIVIMNYDVWGSSSTPGPNAPLANLCGNSTQPVASAAGGVKAWTSAGFPREKILLGVPSYGYINKSTKKSLRQRDIHDDDDDEPTLIPDRRSASSATSSTHPLLERRAALKSMDGSTTSGQINFNSLVSQGALVLNSKTGEYEAGSGYTKYWDDCSDTPYLTSSSSVVTYDDPDSLYDKADFARLAGIAGVAMWSIDGDMTNNLLINSLAAGLVASS